MTEESDFNYLRHSPLTTGLTDDQVQALAGIAYCRRLADQQLLIAEGHVEDSLHIIAEGAIAVTRDLGKGEFTTIHVLRTGDLAGEMGFISGQPHTATLRSLGRTQVCSLEREAFESLIDKDPWLVYRVMCNIIQVSQDILRRMNAQYVELTKYVHRSHAVF
ncbi:cyclic nucleotide-binding domain-containing protein [Lamprobacter modestohalophilus]|uniref:cyclic nucleotide-binding domain-containing protein n=1 Tax=Lamprobacter modestohalophilus TaxID=1064514 RepID=UPI002ADEC519|nr:cyclic nucleotide-binding domain-containing protein [Lamprobacter modestohalophilus]MEA1048635.1 cyclic nucleotide-binding domain-containing protein [Lamprobacter modestohalophilus]